MTDLQNEKYKWLLVRDARKGARRTRKVTFCYSSNRVRWHDLSDEDKKSLAQSAKWFESRRQRETA